MRIFRAPEFLGTAFLLAVLGDARPPAAGQLERRVDDATLAAQLINLLAAVLLLLAFAMLAQRRILSLIDLFAAAGRGARVLRPRSSRYATAPAAPLPVGRPDLRAQGDRCSRGCCTG